MRRIFIFVTIAVISGCVHVERQAVPAAHLVIPPECMQEMACKSDAIIHDGKVSCARWEIKYSCTKVRH